MIEINKIAPSNYYVSTGYPASLGGSYYDDMLSLFMGILNKDSLEKYRDSEVDLGKSEVDLGKQVMCQDRIGYRDKNSLFLRAVHPTGGGYYGMFSVFTNLLGVLNEYSSKKYESKYAGIEVDLGKQGMYYDPNRGDNWWNYYYEPINIGYKSDNNISVIGNEDYGRFAFSAECGLSRQEANAIVKKYFKLRKEIQQNVDRFVWENFDEDYTVSVHYRGTDKVCKEGCEAKRVDADEMIRNIQQHIGEKKLEKFKIFVASDEQKFIDKIQQAFPGKVITTNIERSTNGKPLHNGGVNVTPYELGRGALMDSLLLSRGNILFRTSSNLSLWSTYFNPDMPVVELSKRDGDPCKYVDNSPKVKEEVISLD